MDNLPEIIGQVANSKPIEKAYEDAASPALKEIGKIGSDLVKTARLILAPLQIAATYQDRFEALLIKIKTRIPEQRQIPIAPEISVPALEAIKYLEKESPLFQMFEELLLKAADSENINLAHPAFAHTIKLLSRDEAHILYKLNSKDFDVVDTLSLNKTKNSFENRVIESSTIPESELFNPQSINIYYAHLESLSLVAWPVIKQDPILVGNVQTGVRRRSKIQLTEFGKLFVSACIPSGGFSSPI